MKKFEKHHSNYNSCVLGMGYRLPRYWSFESSRDRAWVYEIDNNTTSLKGLFSGVNKILHAKSTMSI